MMKAAVNMFDAMIITPGGPGAETEAKRFNTHSKLYLFTNSANEKFGSPTWFSEVSATQTFDLKDLEVGSAAEAILPMSAVMKKPAGFMSSILVVMLAAILAVVLSEKLA